MIKVQLKQVLILMLIPLALMVLYSLVINLPALVSERSNPAALAVLSLVALVMGIGLAIIGGVSTTLASLILARQFFTCLIFEEPVSFKENLNFFKQGKVIIFIITQTLVSGALYLFFIFIDFLIISFGVVTAGGMFAFLSGLLKKSLAGSFHLADSLLAAGGVIYLLAIGFLVLALLLMLIGAQLMVLMTPFIVMITSEGNSFTKPYKEAFTLITSNFGKMLPYSMMLVVFNAVLFYTLLFPVFGIGIPLLMLLQKMDPNLVTSGVAYHLKVVGNLISGFIGIISAPLMMASVTLFIYDCKVKTEAFDLQLWLARLALKTDNKVVQLMGSVSHWISVKKGKMDLL